MMDDRFAHHRAEAGHSIRQPLWHLPAMQRKVGTSTSYCHLFFRESLATLKLSYHQTAADGHGSVLEPRLPILGTCSDGAIDLIRPELARGVFMQALSRPGDALPTKI